MVALIVTLLLLPLLIIVVPLLFEVRLFKIAVLPMAPEMVVFPAAAMVNPRTSTKSPSTVLPKAMVEVLVKVVVVPNRIVNVVV